MGQTQEQMDSRWLQLFFGMAKSIGVLYLGIGATAITLTAALRRGAPGARLAIATLLLPFLLIPVVMAPFGLGGPLVYPPLIVVLTGVALFLSREKAPRTTPEPLARDAQPRRVDTGRRRGWPVGGCSTMGGEPTRRSGRGS